MYAITGFPASSVMLPLIMRVKPEKADAITNSKRLKNRIRFM
jgi:hypothetical protein